jgi:hypothetical protein
MAYGLQRRRLPVPDQLSLPNQGLQVNPASRVENLIAEVLEYGITLRYLGKEGRNVII